ncbi:hypothetical protein [Chryseobacterium sp.]|uniref:hypothetical protein n=1 Tax=Chryseobacterium sp. TaxID=1871047 RepID=UPI00321A101F
MSSYNIDVTKKESVNLKNDPAKKISENTGVSERNIDKIKQVIDEIGNVQTYNQIKLKFTDNPVIQSDIEKLKSMRNVVIK